jgi:hypothetical protein
MTRCDGSVAIDSLIDYFVGKTHCKVAVEVNK